MGAQYDRTAKAVGDQRLHIASAINRASLETLTDHGDDWVILGGDLCETPRQLAWVLDLFAKRFAQVIWVPGNHELWSARRPPVRGLEKYQVMLDVARQAGVLTPEDPFPAWPEDPDLILCPLFLLYDYSFRPDDVAREDVVAWAAEQGRPVPMKRCWPAIPMRGLKIGVRRDLMSAGPDGCRSAAKCPHDPHQPFPLRRDLIHIPRIPRFAPWCGTQATENVA